MIDAAKCIQLISVEGRTSLSSVYNSLATVVKLKTLYNYFVIALTETMLQAAWMKYMELETI